MFHHKPVLERAIALENRTQRIKLTRRPFHAHQQFARGHQGRLKDDVFLAVVLRPVAREDSALGIEALEQGGVGKGNEDADGRRIEPRRAIELDGGAENGPVVMIKAEHDAGLDGDAVGVKRRMTSPYSAVRLWRLLATLRLACEMVSRPRKSALQRCERRGT